MKIPQLIDPEEYKTQWRAMRVENWVEAYFSNILDINKSSEYERGSGENKKKKKMIFFAPEAIKDYADEFCEILRQKRMARNDNAINLGFSYDAIKKTAGIRHDNEPGGTPFFYVTERSVPLRETMLPGEYAKLAVLSYLTTGKEPDAREIIGDKVYSELEELANNFSLEGTESQVAVSITRDDVKDFFGKDVKGDSTKLEVLHHIITNEPIELKNLVDNNAFGYLSRLAEHNPVLSNSGNPVLTESRPKTGILKRLAQIRDDIVYSFLDPDSNKASQHYTSG